MFIIRGWVKSPHTDDTNTSYEVKAFINAKPIWGSIVRGHNRADGIGVLLRKIADTYDKMSTFQKNLIEESFQVLYRKELEENRVHCPACGKHLNAKPELAKTQDDLQFCKRCGAGIGKYRREGEATCPECKDK
jgi:hypothetical protein